MPRTRLTPEEREERRKARNAFTFSDAAYQHYDPKTEGYGSAEEWIRQAEAIAGGRSTLGGTAKPKTGLERDLELLNLGELPLTMAALKKAFRNTMFVVHPDMPGGTNEACRDALAAFERLSKHYK
jgi:hypothetical protein